MTISVKDFLQEFKEKKVMNTPVNPNAVSAYIVEKLEIKTYIPFKTKRQIVEMVVSQNTTEVDGIKKNDAIGQYISFVVAMITAHTILEFSADPVSDYDLLSESGLLPQIVAEFKTSYDECDILLKMAVASELEDNNINVFVGKFLNGILQRIDSVGNVLKDKFAQFDLKDILGEDIKPEDMTKLKGFLDKYYK